MLKAIVNLEVGNYYSKSTFIVTLTKKKRNLCSLFYTFESIYMFLQNCLRVPGFPISNFGYPVPEITKNAKAHSLNVYTGKSFPNLVLTIRTSLSNKHFTLLSCVLSFEWCNSDCILCPWS